MIQFVIHLEENLTLALIGTALGQKNIAIVSMAGTTAFGVCTAILLTDNEEGTIDTLKQLDIPFSTQNVLVISIPDEPGSFGHFAQLFKDQEIGVRSFYVLRYLSNRVEIAISVDEADFEKAQSFLDASELLQPG
ncbi:MAG: hypothetical protein ACXAC8_12205 [Candidatus Hodarchaeales archaeon]